MELTYNDLKKRDVINVVDGRCLGRITNMKFSFPKGSISGIFVPGRKVCFLFKIFDRNQLFIESRKIIKIGGDVILVNLKCGDTCSESVDNKHPKPPVCPPYNPCSPCPPPCNPDFPVPPCPPPYPPPCPPHFNYKNMNENLSEGGDNADITGGFEENSRIDMDDYI